MADVFGLDDVSSEDTGAGSKLKTGNLKRGYNMPRGGKLSYKSLAECLKTAKSSSDSTACKQYFEKKTSPEKKKLENTELLDKNLSKIWSRYNEKGKLARFTNTPEQNTQLDSLIQSKLDRIK